MLEKLMRVTMLLEAYSGLLPQKQAEMCASYYMDNLSLSEIGENHGISRQAVHDSIERAIEALEKAEQAIGVVAKAERIGALCESLKAIVSSRQDALGAENYMKMIDMIDEIALESSFGGK